MSASDPSDLPAYLGLLRDAYDRALAELAKIHRHDPAFRGRIAHRALLAVRDQMNPDEPRIGAGHRLLFQH
jgi:hypothetical protein